MFVITSAAKQDVGCWMLDAGYWILDARCWMLDTGFSNFEIRFSNFKVDLLFGSWLLDLGSCFINSLYEKL